MRDRSNPSSDLRRLVLTGVIAVATGLFVLVLVTRQFIRQDSGLMLDRLSQVRLDQLERAAEGISEDLRDIAEDLDFTVRVLHTLPNEAAEERLLGALVGTVRPYRAAVAVTLHPQHAAWIANPHGEGALPDETMKMMEQAAFAAARAGGNLPVVSPPVNVRGEGWFRVFTSASQDAPGEHGAHALSLLVDIQHHFARLRYIATDVQTDVLVLGPEGLASRVSDAAARNAVTAATSEPTAAPTFNAALERMRDGEPGTVILDRRESARLGFGLADSIVAFCPVELGRHARWAVATVSSMAEFRAQEQALIRRFVLSASGIAALLLATFIYVLVISRRAVRLQERLRAADQLAQLREMAERIFESIPTGVLGLSADGRVTAANRALRCRLPDLTLPLPLAQVFPAADPDAVARLAQLAVEAQRRAATVSAHGGEWRLFAEEAFLHLQAVPLTPSRNELCTLLVIEDLSALHQLETQLLRAEKLATVGTLAAGIAHEIGTPLGVIRGRAEMTLGKLPPDAAPAESLRIIIEQIDRVARIVQTLLDFSRGKPTGRARVALAPLGARIGELLAFEATRRSVRLEIALPSDLPPLPGDPDQLEQLLLNLVVNALDASSPGGAVRLTAVAAADNSGSPRVLITVTDQGSGIAAADLHRIFDPFFTTKKRGQGTGLGLTMVAKIARDHGATVDVSSTPGLGSRFVVGWPLAAAKEGGAGGS